MLVSVTPLGHADGDAEAAAGLVVDYLEGKIGANRRVQRPEQPAGSAAGYYADSVEGPGRWTGEGAARLGLAGTVDPEDFRTLLVGVRPGTGETLLDARGSSARAAARHTRPAPEAAADPDELLSVRAAAALIGVAPSYVTRVIRRTTAEAARRLQELFVGAPLSKVSETYLFATRTGPKGDWRVTHREARRFAAARKRNSAVIGYDLTFSAPKSVSILWATADPREAAEIAAAADHAVSVGLAYLESVTSVRDPSRPRVHGLTAASFTHGTSRNLDPQLHVHAVIANVAETITGEHRALDGRDLFAHAKTAGYLAAAELRHRTAQRLGWRWGEVVHGLADVEGVPTAGLAAMSSRKHEIDSLAGELGITSAGGRQVAAYRTRVAKGATDPAELRAEWRTRLGEVGFDDAARARVGGQHRIAPVMDSERQDLLAYLASARGVTEQAAVFDRRDVIQAVASWARDRLSAAAIMDLADEFLASEHAVGLEGRSRERSADVIRLSGGRVVSAADGLTSYSTREMLAAEILVLDAFEAGIDRVVGVASPAAVEAAIAARATLGPDQAAMVRAVCGSGDQFQCVVGPAGSGKTFALDAARQAWEATGYRVLGAADQGTAAEVLGRGAGMRAETLAYWLTRLDTDSDPARIMGPRTVLVVDEASTASTRSLARLFAHARRTGTAVRLVGDPAQHAAVGAGGTFRALVSAHPERTPELSTLRRQEGHDMRHVRMALRDYRDGKIADAFTRLVRDGRVVLADSADELLDRLVADWWRDRQARQEDPTRVESSMVAEHHRERRALNGRARTLLAEAGELAGPALVVAGQEFRRGDEVICRTPAKELHPGGQRARFVRNGTRGVVVDAQPATDVTRGRLVVDFADRGPIEVPMEFLSRRLRPGVVGGLTHSYALTSYAAQGDTYEAARTLGTDASSRPGLYVGLSRGRSDSRVYAVRRRDLDADRERADHMPRLDDEKSALQAVTDRLAASGYEHLASTLDPHAATVGDLRARLDLAALIHVYRSTDGHDRVLAARAIRAERDALATRACIEPAPELLARYGPRPPSGPDRDAWDRAISARTLHDVLDAHGVEWAAGFEALGFPDPAELAAADRDAATRTPVHRPAPALGEGPPSLSM